MWRIAKRYHLSFNNLRALNEALHKNVDLIHPNDDVLLPHEDSEGHSTNEASNGDQIEDGNERASETQILQEMKDVLNLVNQERSKYGLNKLTLSLNILLTQSLKFCSSIFIPFNISLI